MINEDQLEQFSPEWVREIGWRVVNEVNPLNIVSQFDSLIKLDVLLKDETVWLTQVGIV